MFLRALNNPWLLGSSWVLMTSLADPILLAHENGGAPLNVWSMLNHINVWKQRSVAGSAHICWIIIKRFSNLNEGWGESGSSSGTRLGGNWTFHNTVSWHVIVMLGSSPRCKRKANLLMSIIDSFVRKDLSTLIFSQARSHIHLRGELKYVLEHLSFLISGSSPAANHLTCLRPVVQGFKDIRNVGLNLKLFW